MMRSLCRCPTRRPALGAFTLAEMLAVLGIILILLAITVPAVRNLSANKLNNAGRFFSNVLTLARSDAINQRALVQIRIVTTAWKSNGADDPSLHYRRFSLWRHKPPPVSGAAADLDPYTQVSAWETLPDGIIFETNHKPAADTDYPFANANPGPGTYFLDADSVPNLTKADVAIPGGSMDAACIEFTPTGSLNINGSTPVSALYFLLVPGFASNPGDASANGGPALTYQPPHHPNWVMVQVTPLTGRIQIVRP